MIVTRVMLVCHVSLVRVGSVVMSVWSEGVGSVVCHVSLLRKMEWGSVMGHVSLIEGVGSVVCHVSLRRGSWERCHVSLIRGSWERHVYLLMPNPTRESVNRKSNVVEVSNSGCVFCWYKEAAFSFP